MFKSKELSNLFFTIRARLFKSVAKIVPPDEIEDIVQETYVRVCQFDNNHTITHPTTFMFKTARNLALDHVKKSESVLTDCTDAEEDFNAGENRFRGDETYHKASSNNDFELFCKAVRTLPRQCRKAFVLKKVYGYSHKEIAARLNISDRTVEKHVATGITRCGRYMNKHTEYGKKTIFKRPYSYMSTGKEK